LNRSEALGLSREEESIEVFDWSGKDEALRLAGTGLRFIPIRYGQKTPMTEHGYKDAVRTYQEIEWFPTGCNAAVVFGAIWEVDEEALAKLNLAKVLEESRNENKKEDYLVGIDVDVRIDSSGVFLKDGLETLRKLEAGGKRFVPKAQFKTGNGGVQFLRRIRISRKRAKELGLRNIKELFPGIEFRFENCYSLIPGSFVFPSESSLGDGHYRWIGEEPESLEDIPYLEDWVEARVFEIVSGERKGDPNPPAEKRIRKRAEGEKPEKRIKVERNLLDPLVKLLYDRLDGVSRCGEGISFRCPAHDDRNPSATADLTESGVFLMHCHKEPDGCRVEDMASKLGIRMRWLYPKYRYEIAREVNWKYDLVYLAVMEYLKDNPDGFEGTMEEFHQKLEGYVPDYLLDTRAWTKSGAALSRRINCILKRGYRFRGYSVVRTRDMFRRTIHIVPEECALQIGSKAEKKTGCVDTSYSRHFNSPYDRKVLSVIDSGEPLGAVKEFGIKDNPQFGVDLEGKMNEVERIDLYGIDCEDIRKDLVVKSITGSISESSLLFDPLVRLIYVKLRGVSFRCPVCGGTGHQLTVEISDKGLALVSCKSNSDAWGMKKIISGLGIEYKWTYGKNRHKVLEEFGCQSDLVRGVLLRVLRDNGCELSGDIEDLREKLEKHVPKYLLGTICWPRNNERFLGYIREALERTPGIKLEDSGGKLRIFRENCLDKGYKGMIESSGTKVLDSQRGSKLGILSSGIYSGRPETRLERPEVNSSKVETAPFEEVRENTAANVSRPSEFSPNPDMICLILRRYLQDNPGGFVGTAEELISDLSEYIPEYLWELAPKDEEEVVGVLRSILESGKEFPGFVLGEFIRDGYRMIYITPVVQGFNSVEKFSEVQEEEVEIRNAKALVKQFASGNTNGGNGTNRPVVKIDLGEIRGELSEFIRIVRSELQVMRQELEAIRRDRRELVGVEGIEELVGKVQELKALLEGLGVTELRKELEELRAEIQEIKAHLGSLEEIRTEIQEIKAFLAGVEELRTVVEKLQGFNPEKILTRIDAFEKAVWKEIDKGIMSLARYIDDLGIHRRIDEVRQDLMDEMNRLGYSVEQSLKGKKSDDSGYGFGDAEDNSRRVIEIMKSRRNNPDFWKEVTEVQQRVAQYFDEIDARRPAVEEKLESGDPQEELKQKDFGDDPPSEKQSESENSGDSVIDFFAQRGPAEVKLETYEVKPAQSGTGGASNGSQNTVKQINTITRSTPHPSDIPWSLENQIPIIRAICKLEDEKERTWELLKFMIKERILLARKELSPRDAIVGHFETGLRWEEVTGDVNEFTDKDFREFPIPDWLEWLARMTLKESFLYPSYYYRDLFPFIPHHHYMGYTPPRILNKEPYMRAVYNPLNNEGIPTIFAGADDYFIDKDEEPNVWDGMRLIEWLSFGKFGKPLFKLEKGEDLESPDHEVVLRWKKLRREFHWCHPYPVWPTVFPQALLNGVLDRFYKARYGLTYEEVGHLYHEMTFLMPLFEVVINQSFGSFKVRRKYAPEWFKQTLRNVREHRKKYGIKTGIITDVSFFPEELANLEGTTAVLPDWESRVPKGMSADDYGRTLKVEDWRTE